MKNNFLSLFKSQKPIIGMVHLLAMPNSNGYVGFETTLQHALNELDSLEKGGIDGILIENDNDSPYTLLADPATVAVMTAITAKIVEKSNVPVGVEVLLNDPKASLSIAVAGGAQFIRTDYFVDRMSRPEYGGEISINPQEILDFRSKLKAEDIFILADVQVKHAQLLEVGKTISSSVKQAEQAGADGVIVSGNFTGEQPVVDDLKEAMEAVENIPVLIGSGFSLQNSTQLLPHTNGVIVGSSIKENGKVSLQKTSELMSEVRSFL